ncbi:MAG: COX15/CtaA family protein [Deltaproteobacteria bacterium]|nr:COX15/CtaA family protein [Deltaproteobacteria bacterium]
MPAFTRFAWAVLGYNLLVVAWGAFVRATGSGAGCGQHWPTCNGQVLPRAPRLETVIEFTHRATSGIALVLVVVLLVWAFRAFPRGHAARKAAVAALAFMISEALVGAGLVLYGWVARDTSAARGWVMAIHLTNTFLLLAALALCAEWSRRPGGLAAPPGRLRTLLGVALLAVLVTGITGAIAALGDTLYPARSLAHGLEQELAPGATLLLRLRLLHPFVAVAAAVATALAARGALHARPRGRVPGLATAVLTLVAGQLVLGAVNVALLAPVALQLAHLLVADLTWIALVLLASAALGPAERVRAGAVSAAA